MKEAIDEETAIDVKMSLEAAIDEETRRMLSAYGIECKHVEHSASLVRKQL